MSDIISAKEARLGTNLTIDSHYENMKNAIIEEIEISKKKGLWYCVVSYPSEMSKKLKEELITQGYQIYHRAANDNYHHISWKE